MRAFIQPKERDIDKRRRRGERQGKTKVVSRQFNDLSVSTTALIFLRFVFFVRRRIWLQKQFLSIQLFSSHCRLKLRNSQHPHRHHHHHHRRYQHHHRRRHHHQQSSTTANLRPLPTSTSSSRITTVQDAPIVHLTVCFGVDCRRKKCGGEEAVNSMRSERRWRHTAIDCSEAFREMPFW